MQCRQSCEVWLWSWGHENDFKIMWQIVWVERPAYAVQIHLVWGEFFCAPPNPELSSESPDLAPNMKGAWQSKVTTDSQAALTIELQAARSVTTPLRLTAHIKMAAHSILGLRICTHFRPFDANWWYFDVPLMFGWLLLLSRKKKIMFGAFGSVPNYNFYMGTQNG